MIDPDRATGRAAAANRVGRMQEPNAAFEPEVPGRQCANRTYVDHVARIWIVEGFVLKCSDCDVISATEKLHLTGLGHVLKEPNTSRAQHAPLLVEHNHRPKIYHLPLAHLHPKRDLAGVQPVHHVVVLQAALARLIADRTINRVIDQQELEYTAHGFLDSLILGAHYHPVIDERRARRRQLGHLLDVYQAHATVSVDGKVRVIAIVRDLHAVIGGSLNDCLPRLGFDFLSV